MHRVSYQKFYFLFPEQVEDFQVALCSDVFDWPNLCLTLADRTAHTTVHTPDHLLVLHCHANVERTVVRELGYLIPVSWTMRSLLTPHSANRSPIVLTDNGIQWTHHMDRFVAYDWICGRQYAQAKYTVGNIENL